MTRARGGYASPACALLFITALACGTSSGEDGAGSPPSRDADHGASRRAIEQALSSIVATCAQVSGKAEIRRAGQAFWEPATLGAPLREGDWLKTGPHGLARIQFLGRGAIDLDENTAIIIEAALADASAGKRDEVGVGLQAGSIRGVVARHGAASSPGQVPPLFFSTGDGSRAHLVARGDSAPAFRLTRRGAHTEVAVTEGQLRVVTGERNQQLELDAGQATDIGKNRLGPVVSLIDFPTSLSPGIDARFLYRDELRIRLRWRPVPGASRYRVQVARDISFQNNVTVFEEKRSQIKFIPEGEGTYAWRVAAYDRNGRMSEFGFARRIFCEKEPPHDLLISPRDGAKFRAASRPPAIVFSWQPAGNATSYRLLIGRKEDPREDPILDIKTSAQRHVVEKLLPDRYFWGVYTARGGQPIFLTPRSFSIQPPREDKRRHGNPRVRPQAVTKGLWE